MAEEEYLVSLSLAASGGSMQVRQQLCLAFAHSKSLFPPSAVMKKRRNGLLPKLRR